MSLFDECFDQPLTEGTVRDWEKFLDHASARAALGEIARQIFLQNRLTGVDLLTDGGRRLAVQKQGQIQGALMTLEILFNLKEELPKDGTD